jgi:hypothetical protein
MDYHITESYLSTNPLEFNDKFFDELSDITFSSNSIDLNLVSSYLEKVNSIYKDKVIDVINNVVVITYDDICRLSISMLEKYLETGTVDYVYLDNMAIGIELLIYSKIRHLIPNVPIISCSSVIKNKNVLLLHDVALISCSVFPNIDELTMTYRDSFTALILAPFVGHLASQNDINKTFGVDQYTVVPTIKYIDGYTQLKSYTVKKYYNDDVQTNQYPIITNYDIVEEMSSFAEIFYGYNLFFDDDYSPTYEHTLVTKTVNFDQTRTYIRKLNDKSKYGTVTHLSSEEIVFDKNKPSDIESDFDIVSYSDTLMILSNSPNFNVPLMIKTFNEYYTYARETKDVNITDIKYYFDMFSRTMTIKNLDGLSVIILDLMDNNMKFPESVDTPDLYYMMDACSKLLLLKTHSILKNEGDYDYGKSRKQFLELVESLEHL